MDYREIMWAELKADCYAGDSCDQIEPRWNCYADGDKQDENLPNKEAIELSAEHMPIGAKVVISVPVCPECDYSHGDCSCGFDWESWVVGKYC